MHSLLSGRLSLVRRLPGALSLLTSFLLVSVSFADDVEWVTVGSPGNPCDAQPQGCFGSVPEVYRIGKYEVTNQQYADFLNAVAETDTHELYSSDMGTSKGGIVRSGSAGSHTYAAVADRERKPVNFVGFYDSLRFANWLHNGSPTGSQGSLTTEDGAYTLTDSGMSLNDITRNPGATVFLTSENEWYKAAFFDAISASFFDYASHSDSTIECSMPGPGSNSANCAGAVGDLTVVGAYLNSISPYGTFDQSGNVQEWNESRSGNSGRGLRSGSYGSGHAFAQSASSRSTGNAMFPGQEFVGFRVASTIPEPSTALLVGAGLLGMAAARRRS